MGKTAVLYQQAGPRKVGLFNGDLLDQKSKSPLFPGGGVAWQAWLQMASALSLCIVSS